MKENKTEKHLPVEMEYHNFCLLFPQAEKEVLESMAADIEKNGLREPIVTYEGKILDGRNRYLACEIAEVKPEYTEYDGDKDSAFQFVLSKNASRRHLCQGLRAVIAAKLSAKKNSNNENPQAYGFLTQEKAAIVMGVSVSQIQIVARLFREAPDLITEIEQGDLSVNAALEKIKTPKSKTTPAAKKEKRKSVEQDNDDDDTEITDDEMPDYSDEVEQDEQESDDIEEMTEPQEEKRVEPSTASSDLSEEVLKQIRDILRPYGNDEKKLADLFVGIVQDMVGEFISDKCRNRFLRGVKEVLCEYGV